ncbi:MAG: hypothetical protein HEQ13_02700 [Dolichospermum sp. DEX189]|nr:hypothetical protein [Dolichospermum sp. DEX189]
MPVVAQTQIKEGDTEKSLLGLGVWEVRSLFWGCGGDSEALLQAVRFLGCGGDSEALLQAVRFLGCGRAIAKRCCKQFVFGGVGCDRFLECGGVIAFWMWEGDSEALLQAVRFLGYGRAIAFGDEGGRSLLGMREGDRFLGMREGDRFLGCGSAITFGMWEGDSEALLQAVRFWGCGGDSEALLQAVRFWGMWGDRFLVWSAIVF